MGTYDDVLGAAQGLTPTDRIRLVQALWETVPPEDWPKPSLAWIEEAQRRSAEYDAGHVTASPWPEVRARARRVPLLACPAVWSTENTLRLKLAIDFTSRLRAS